MYRGRSYQLQPGYAIVSDSERPHELRRPEEQLLRGGTVFWATGIGEVDTQMPKSSRSVALPFTFLGHAYAKTRPTCRINNVGYHWVDQWCPGEGNAPAGGI